MTCLKGYLTAFQVKIQILSLLIFGKKQNTKKIVINIFWVESKLPHHVHTCVYGIFKYFILVLSQLNIHCRKRMCKLDVAKHLH